jgi:hypothetical protein
VTDLLGKPDVPMSFVANPNATINAAANLDVPMSIVTSPAATISSVAAPKPVAIPDVPVSPDVSESRPGRRVC